MTTLNAPSARGERRNLRRARERRGWSQERLCREICKLGAELGVSESDLGVDQGRVSEWERGRAQPGAIYAALICRLLDLPPEKLDLPKLPSFLLPAPDIEPATA